MKYYVVTSRMPVLMEWPEKGEAKALPHGALFQAKPGNMALRRLLRIGNKVREAAPHEIPSDDEPVVLLDD